MQYLISFLEGFITVISPCILPLLPLYVTYFAGNDKDGNPKNVLKNSLGFVLGFTIVFVSLGALAGSIGMFLKMYSYWVNIILGIVVILFGLNFLGIIKFNLWGKGTSKEVENLGFFSSLTFGMVFSIGWTPCVSAFLGSALLLASQQGSVITGVIMLFFYSIGLGIPLILCALLINKLKNAFDFIKRNYSLINKVCGILLIILGILMALGKLN
ncbi:MAG: cytochrome c biogenesis CcdA family protein [Eubacteriales bacterium]|nr:cytochrome c biogenesis CcdA family protein [Eubacteriales bacterium]